MNEYQEKLLETFVEIELENPEDFLIVKETLSRIGIGSNKTKKLSPSCGILHKHGKYYVVHFLEMFMLDHKQTHFSDSDRARRNAIAYLLQEWGLVKIKDPKKIEDRLEPSQLKIVSFKDKKNWLITEKYSIGE